MENLNDNRVKIITGLIAGEKDLFEKAENALLKKFGPIDLQSEVLLFNHTDYYTEEMGKPLLRKFVSFKKLVKPDGIQKIKLFTNKLEDAFSSNGKRRINVDPGYLTAAKLVLLSTKDYTHRIYLGSGIYAEVTLHYKYGVFEPWQWSYPDYKTPDYKNFFIGVRRKYLDGIK